MAEFKVILCRSILLLQGVYILAWYCYSVVYFRTWLQTYKDRTYTIYT